MTGVDQNCCGAVNQKTADPEQTNAMQTEEPEGVHRRPAGSAISCRDHDGPSDQGLQKNQATAANPSVPVQRGPTQKLLTNRVLRLISNSSAVPGRFREEVCRLGDAQQRGGKKKSTIPEKGLCKGGVQIDVEWTQSGGRLG